jgi:hypothetical protein
MDYGYLRVDNLTGFAYIGNDTGVCLPPWGGRQSRTGTCLQPMPILGLQASTLCDATLACAATGVSPPEKFIGYDPSDPGSTRVITSGMPVLLVSMQTGLFCRLAVYDRPSIGRRLNQAGGAVVYGMLGDQPSAATATLFIYSRTGLVFGGEPMVADGLFKPLLWSNTRGVVTGTGNTTITPLPTGGLVACL